MQLSVYISEVVDLNNVNEAEARLQKTKIENKITGITSVSRGYCLQIIEGLEKDMTAPICDIFMDNSLQNHTLILIVEAKQRLFPDRSMSTVSSLCENESFMVLVELLNNNIDLLSYSDKRLMSLFHSVEERKIPSSDQANPLNPLVYSISEWPDFGGARPSYNLLSLCSYLRSTATCFRTLVSQNIFGNEQRVRLMLKQLNAAGYLHVAQQRFANEHVCEFHDGSLQQDVEFDESVFNAEEVVRVARSFENQPERMNAF